MKRILVLVGSARRNGNSEALADAFIAGAKKQHFYAAMQMKGKLCASQ